MSKHIQLARHLIRVSSTTLFNTIYPYIILFIVVLIYIYKLHIAQSVLFLNNKEFDE